MSRDERKIVREELVSCQFSMFVDRMKHICGLLAPTFPVDHLSFFSHIVPENTAISSARATWTFSYYPNAKREKGWAVVEAYPEGQGTRVRCLDCCGQDWPDTAAACIGEPFDAFAERVMQEAQKLESGPAPSSERCQRDVHNLVEGVPWQKIPDRGYDRAMLQLWWEECPCSEIATRVDRTEKTIRNRLSILRGCYGTDTVPKRTSAGKLQKSG